MSQFQDFGFESLVRNPVISKVPVPTIDNIPPVPAVSPDFTPEVSGVTKPVGESGLGKIVFPLFVLAAVCAVIYMANKYAKKGKLDKDKKS